MLYSKRKHRCILDYLETRYSNLLPAALTYEETTKPLPVWVFWYQGRENMPPVVEMCFRSVLKNACGRPVYLLHKDNMQDFVRLPDYILRKVERKEITVTHLSDILRLCLLSEYGGHWLDATLYVNKPLTEESLDPLFQSIKMKPLVAGTISDYRWSSFCLYSKPKASTIIFFRDVLLAYYHNKRHKCTVDYLLIDYTFQMLYENNAEFKRLVDDRPQGNAYTYSMVKELNSPVDYRLLELWKDQQFFKLSWKRTVSGAEDTLFSYLYKNTQ